jgi:BirA family biotin operon repressor/biotin-[acetyl-CoA-carboxylase] ligase
MPKLYHFNSLTSTQDKAKEFAKKGLSNIAIVADAQTKGRGRFKRKWHSAKGGLWMSILLKPKKIHKLQYLTFAAAIAVVKAIKKISNLSTKIKWPNDVHYKGKKLCGILTEGIFPANYVIVGIGLNVNQNKFPEDIKHTAISLKMIKNQEINIKKLSKNIINGFFNIYNNQYEKNKLDNILKTWKRYCNTINKDVAVVTKTKKFKGRVIGIDKDCNLLLKLKNKKIIKIIEGDINVRY